MARYDFECGKCGNIFEVTRSAHDESAVKCPKCGRKANKLFSASVNFIFKGTGFYATDYKKKDKIPKSSKNGSGQSPPKADQSPAKETAGIKDSD